MTGCNLGNMLRIVVTLRHTDHSHPSSSLPSLGTRVTGHRITVTGIPFPAHTRLHYHDRRLRTSERTIIGAFTPPTSATRHETQLPLYARRLNEADYVRGASFSGGRQPTAPARGMAVTHGLDYPVHNGQTRPCVCDGFTQKSPGAERCIQGKKTI